jgi:hypothetical protein
MKNDSITCTAAISERVVIDIWWTKELPNAALRSSRRGTTGLKWAEMMFRRVSAVGWEGIVERVTRIL